MKHHFTSSEFFAMEVFRVLLDGGIAQRPYTDMVSSAIQSVEWSREIFQRVITFECESGGGIRVVKIKITMQSHRTRKGEIPSLWDLLKIELAPWRGEFVEFVIPRGESGEYEIKAEIETAQEQLALGLAKQKLHSQLD